MRRSPRTLIFAACGLLLGTMLTVGGYLVDYHSLYGELPTNFTLGTLRGLHDVTPVHYFADLFALILALAGGLVGWLQDRVIFYSKRLEQLVETRTSDLRSTEGQLQHMVLHDALTDLPNRTALLDRLGRILQPGRREGANVALLQVGVDRFKKINQALGPETADWVLVEVARQLSNVVERFDRDHRTVGSVFRHGGDEFVVVLEKIRSVRDATRLADRILAAHQRTMEIDDAEVIVNVSVGIAIAPGRYRKQSEIIRDAQAAMHQAKVQGRSRFEVFDREMSAATARSVHLETQLYQALEAGQLELWYQPVVGLRTRQVAGFEALVRWQHPERGIVSPGEFIPVAEDSGLIVPISQRLFESAVATLRRWQDVFDNRRPISIKMNLSPKYLFDPKLESHLVAMIEETGSDPSRLHLEVTESSFIDRPGDAAEILHRLKSRGFMIALDDFGTGFSSLSLLHELPFDILKIDRSFVGKMTVEPDVRKIIATIVNMGEQLGLEVVAEGIEEEDQFRELRSMRCKYGQGYLLGAPVTVDAAERLIASQVRRRARKAS